MLPPDVAAALSTPAREGACRLDDAGTLVPVPARERTIEDLVAEIAAHHAEERRALPYVVALLAKAAGCHRGRNAKLGVLCDVGQELAEGGPDWIGSVSAGRSRGFPVVTGFGVGWSRSTDPGWLPPSRPGDVFHRGRS